MSEEIRGEQEEFDFFDWLADGIQGVRRELRRGIRRPRVLPEAFWEHAQASRREALLAFRSLIDAAIERAEKHEEEPAKRGGRRAQAKKIEVQ
ncbi:MAG: hypothetical protein Kow0047_04180 [Anaerolineae bacterium]